MLHELQTFRRRLLAWYDRHRRDLPWRVSPTAERGTFPDPYQVLVSELMLQQTQVATVIPYFRRFLSRFPTVLDLANAPEQEVLRLWQGLGYYSRARNLQAAARAIVREHEGRVPSDLDALLALPGVGRYTAGAVASLAFDRRAPILDGNVARVLCRIDCIEADPREPATQRVLWDRAAQILPKRRAGDFNSALMELGATVCMPRSPRCLTCPVQAHCEALAAGLEECIPPARKTKPIPLLRRWTLCIRHNNQWLIEQRPAKGRWAGMWQFFTIEPPETQVEAKPTPAHIRSILKIATTAPKRIGEISHGLTHRRYEFEVFACQRLDRKALPEAPERPTRWVTLEQLENYPLPRPHAKIAGMLAGRRGKPEKPRSTTAG